MNTSNFNWHIRVYYEDTDSGGIVFYANYLKFFERARTEWLRTAGISQRALEQNDRIFFVAKNTQIDYHAPARLDDQLRLTVIPDRIGHASLHFTQQAWLLDSTNPSLLATARITIACIAADTFRPCALPAKLKHAIRSGNAQHNFVSS